LPGVIVGPGSADGRKVGSLTAKPCGSAKSVLFGALDFAKVTAGA
jgi:hypothetical protein